MEGAVTANFPDIVILDEKEKKAMIIDVGTLIQGAVSSLQELNISNKRAELADSKCTMCFSLGALQTKLRLCIF
eukprot:9400663-Ditylum_brightwellii.AAC.1